MRARRGTFVIEKDDGTYETKMIPRFDSIRWDVDKKGFIYEGRAHKHGRKLGRLVEFNGYPVERID